MPKNVSWIHIAILVALLLAAFYVGKRSAR